MNQEWAPPQHERLLTESDHPDPYRDALVAPADELAPVDRQADPAHWLPGKWLTIVAAIVGFALLATIVVCLIIWLTPPMHHVQVPSIPKS